jgi:hypothetical protein
VDGESERSVRYAYVTRWLVVDDNTDREKVRRCPVFRGDGNIRALVKVMD